MRKLLVITIFLITLSTALAQNNIYQQDSLHLELSINGQFELVSEGAGARVSEATTELLLFPQDDFRQEVLELNNLGEVEGNKNLFTWNNPSIGTHQFGYSAIVKTNNKRRQVSSKIPFPPTDISSYEQYTLPTDKIDSNNQKIIAKAAELAEGEDDLFKVSFKLANWVSENINYKLNSLTTNVAQPASWVLQNKQGVCDEMTTLFVAMARSLGIPARFVSGISYTEDKDVIAAVGKNWAGHGWAEVYFPEVGWVGFDITFDEYGYIDVTHIKLRESFDPDEPATKFGWLADKVNMETQPLDLDVKIKQEGNIVPEEILLEQEITAPEVDFGSYNLVKGVLKNTANYYVATTLKLAVPDEISILGKNRRTILLAPKEVKETFWQIKVADNLNPIYQYEFPILIYSEKNATVKGEFGAKPGKAFYSKNEIESLTVKDEEKSYSRKISFDCDYQPQIALNEEITVSCSIKNSGNTNLKKVNFCLAEKCQVIDLPINQEESIETTIKGETTGWNKITLSAENNFIEKKSSLSYTVLDIPTIKTEVIAPDKVNFGKTITVNINLVKESFNVPKKVTVLLKGSGFENHWEIEELTQEQKLQLEMENLRLSKTNKFTVITQWQDEESKLYSKEQEIIVKGEAENFIDRVKMLLNGILNLLM